MSKIRLHGTSSGYTEIVPKAAAASNTLTAPSTVGELIAKDAAGAIGITSVQSTNANFSGTTRITSGISTTLNITTSNITTLRATTGITTTAVINSATVGGVNTLNSDGVNTTGIVTASTFIPSAGQLTNRNIMINGAMNVAQRGTSDTTDAQNFTTVDRWQVVWSGLEEQPSKYQEQLSASDTGPWEKGFRNAWKLQNGNQTGGADASGYINPQYTIEAQDLASSGWNPKDTSSKLTLSFWAKSSVAQTFYSYLYVNDGGGDSYSFSYTLAANTWKKIEQVIPGHADLAVDNNAEAGMTIYLPLFLGTDRTTSGHTLNQWQSWNSSNRTPDQTTTWYTTNDATWHMTGIQLEVGSVATPFEHRSFAEEEIRCMRYFQKVHNAELTSSMNTTTRMRIAYKTTVPMRAAPSWVRTTTALSFQGPGVNVQSTDTSAAQNGVTGTTLITWDFGGFSSLGQRSWIGSDANHVFSISSEL